MSIRMFGYRKPIATIFLFFILVLDSIGQDFYLGAGLNYAIDRLYLDSNNLGQSIAILYVDKNSKVNCDLSYSYINSNNFAVPVTARLNATNKIGFAPGVGISLWNFEDSFDVGAGPTLGFSHDIRDVKILLSGSYFFGLKRQSFEITHPGGTFFENRRNGLFSLKLIVFYKVYSQEN